MKNSGFIIKIAVIIAAVAAAFSLVTLIRSIVIGSSIAFPVIQLIGSCAIFAVCFLMFRSMKANGTEDSETDEDNAAESDADSDGQDEAGESETEAETGEERQNSDPDAAEKAVDELYEKYNLSDFEE